MVTEAQLSIVGVIIFLIVYFKIKLLYLRRKEIRLNNQIFDLRHNLNTRHVSVRYILRKEDERSKRTEYETGFGLTTPEEKQIRKHEKKVYIDEEEKEIDEIIDRIDSKKKKLKQTEQQISQMQKYTFKSLLGPINHFFSSLAPKDLVPLIVALITLIIAILKFIKS